MTWHGGFGTDRFATEPTYSVGELAEEVKEIVGGTFRDLWVRGEIQRLHASSRGHLYFELVEKGAGDRIVGKLDGVLWRTDHQRVRRQLAAEGHRLAEGQEVRCFGGLDFYPAGGRLQLVVRDLDPSFTLGELERRRRRTLAALEQADLLETNGRLEVPALPLRLGLVTSQGSAAHHDLISGLEASGYAFRLLFVHASVQGAGAEDELAAALELLGSAQPAGAPLDALLLVRGGGARTDLAAFDSRAVAFAVAQCPLPVICGLGHQTDSTVTDQVVHTSLKTPTMVAEWIVGRVAAADRRLEQVQRGLAGASQRQLLRAEQIMGRGERLARLAGSRLEARHRALDDAAQRLTLLSRQRLERLQPRLELIAQRLELGARRGLDAGAHRVDVVGRGLARAGAGRLAQVRAHLDATARLCHGLEPQRLLERGFSVTRNAAGDVVSSPDQVRSGDRLVSQLRDGDLISRVEET